MAIRVSQMNCPQENFTHFALPDKLNMFWFFINISTAYWLLFPIIFFHELGHALTGRILKFKIFSMDIGIGRNLFEQKIFGIPIKLNSIPRQGLTLGIPENGVFYRLRYWLYTLGGPSVHILWFAAFYLLLGQGLFLETIQPKALFLNFSPQTIFLYLNLLVFWSNIYPRKLKLITGVTTSDGYKLMTIPFRKASLLESEFKTIFEVMRTVELIKEEKYEEAKLIYRQIIEDSPENFALQLNLGQIEVLEGNIDEAKIYFTNTLEKIEAEFPEEQKYQQIKFMLYNNLAWVNIVYPDDSLIKQADEYSRKALHSSPNHAAFIGTRGAVLVRRGEINPGLEMLKKAYKFHSDETSKSSDALFIAFGEAQLGNENQSLKWLEKARQHSSTHWLFALLEKEILQVNDMKAADNLE